VSAHAGDAVVRKLVTFGRILREAGVEVGPGRLQNALLALDAVDLRRRDEVYAALACTMVARRDDLEIFDRAFRAWFERAPTRGRGQRPPDLGLGIDEQKKPQVLAGHGLDRAGEGDDEDDAPTTEDAVAAWSPVEVLRQRDFAAMTREELLRVRAVMERLARTLPTRPSRRLEASDDGRRIDPRGTLRRAMRHEGEPVERAFRRPKQVERRCVFLCDVSGSMEPYARALVLFLQAAVATGRNVEAFTFGTRLTRLTPYLDGRDPERALDRAARAVPDWAGGTRIGEALHAFNDIYARRGMTRSAVVTIASDGWERGDVSQLRDEMARLRRRSRALVWVNPLKGSAGYEPLAAGMAAALPYCDVFLPGHNLAALEGLADAIAVVGRERLSRPTVLRSAA
jgi:uncharacterized protein with von Willebrand factor type A (vWA) domain